MRVCFGAIHSSRSRALSLPTQKQRMELCVCWFWPFTSEIEERRTRRNCVCLWGRKVLFWLAAKHYCSRRTRSKRKCTQPIARGRPAMSTERTQFSGKEALEWSVDLVNYTMEIGRGWMHPNVLLLFEHKTGSDSKSRNFSHSCCFWVETSGSTLINFWCFISGFQDVCCKGIIHICQQLGKLRGNMPKPRPNILFLL